MRRLQKGSLDDADYGFLVPSFGTGIFVCTNLDYTVQEPIIETQGLPPAY